MTGTPALRVEGSFPRDPRLYVRDHATFLRESLRETAAEHHRRHIPRHFLAFAPSKYGYLPRSPRYLRLKRVLGLTEPLVFSGAMRAQVTSGRTITATQRSASLFMRWDLKGSTGRFRFRKWQTQLSGAQMRVLGRIQELKAVSPDEQRYLADFLGQRYAEKANAPGVTHRTRNRAARA